MFRAKLIHRRGSSFLNTQLVFCHLMANAWNFAIRVSYIAFNLWKYSRHAEMYIISMWANEFPQTEHAHIVITQIKRQRIEHTMSYCEVVYLKFMLLTSYSNKFNWKRNRITIYQKPPPGLPPESTTTPKVTAITISKNIDYLPVF